MEEDVLTLSDEEKIKYIKDHYEEINIRPIYQKILDSLKTQDGIVQALSVIKGEDNKKQFIITRFSEENILKFLEFNSDLSSKNVTDIILSLPEQYWNKCLHNPKIKDKDEDRIHKAIKSEKDFKKAKDFINIAKDQEGQDFIIDGDDDFIGEVKVNNLLDLEFSNGGTKEDLVWIHATNYFPDNGTILNSKTKKVISANTNHEVFYSHRNTLHGALNHHVSSHTLGNFEGRKYTILQPVEDIKEDIKDISDVDTYIWGNMTLSPRAIILVNEENYDELTEEQKSDDRIIKYRGDLKNAERKAMILLGKKPQKADIGSINNSNNITKIDKLGMQIGIARGEHYWSIHSQFEQNAEHRDFRIAQLRGLTIDAQSMEELKEKAKNSQLLDTTDPIDITLEEFRTIYRGENTAQNFEKFLVEYGIEYKDNKFTTLTDDDAIKRFEEYDKKEDKRNPEFEKLFQEYQKQCKLVDDNIKKQNEIEIRNKRKKELLSTGIINGIQGSSTYIEEFVNIINEEIYESGIEAYQFALVYKKLFLIRFRHKTNR